jgi:predicted transcriptional regulator
VGKKKNQWVRREVRYEQMVRSAMLIEHRGKRPTVATICKNIGISVSTHARSIINELSDKGYLHRLQTIHWNGRTSYVYLVNNEKLFADCPDWYKETAALIGIQLTLPMESI